MEEAPYQCNLPSQIHGVGVFATRPIKKGEWVPTPMTCGITECQGFNHSCAPNLGDRVHVKEGIFRAAQHDIQVGEEMTVSYSNLACDGSVHCKCAICQGKQPAQTCRCPIHRKEGQ